MDTEREWLSEIDDDDSWRGRFRDWRRDVAADPGVLVKPATRIGLLLAFGFGLYFLAGYLAAALAPSLPPGETGKATPLATVHVVCTDPDCGKHFATRVPRDFTDWPITCEPCQARTAIRGKPCAKCRKWIDAALPGDQCPYCLAAERARREAEGADRSQISEIPQDIDDAEDGW